MNKELERYHLDLFLGAFPQLARGSIEEGEKPDCLLVTADTRIGLEHTSLFHHGPQVRAREANESLVAALAQRSAESRGCPPLLVFVDLSLNAAITKPRLKALADELADLVLSHLPDAGECVEMGLEWPRLSLLPVELVTLRAARPGRIRTGIWQPSRVGIVPFDFRDTLQREVSSKDGKVSTYLQRCDECWLLVVATGDVPSAFVDVNGGVQDAVFQFSFQRAFFLDAFGKYAFELRRSEST